MLHKSVCKYGAVAAVVELGLQLNKEAVVVDTPLVDHLWLPPEVLFLTPLALEEFQATLVKVVLYLAYLLEVARVGILAVPVELEMLLVALELLVVGMQAAAVAAPVRLL